MVAKNLINIGRRSVIKRLIQSGAAGLATGGLAYARKPSPTLRGEKKIIFVFTPQGAVAKYWNPIECARHFVLPPMSQPLESVKKHCVFLSNLDMTWSGHGYEPFVLGMNFSPIDTSLDNQIADHINQNRAALMPNLRLAVDAHNSISYRDTRAIPFLDDPAEGYNLLFDSEELKRAVHPLFRERFENISASMDFDFDDASEMQIELAVLALQHQRSHVATIMLGDSDANISSPKRNLENFHFAVTGYGPKLGPYIQFRAYLSEKIAYLLKLLEITTDSEGVRMIDNTLVVQVTDMGDGGMHTANDAPFLLAGANLHRKSQKLVYDVQGKSEKNLFDSIANFMELSSETFGQEPLEDLL